MFALAGEQGALLGEAIVSGLLNAVMFVLMVCVMAAVHTQFSRLATAPQPDAED